MSAGEAAATFDRRTRRHSAPPERLWDRHDQLAELRALWAGVLPAPPAWVVVVGGWGTGKTALLNAAGNLARHGGRTVVTVRARRAERCARFAVAREVVEGLRRELAEPAVDGPFRAQDIRLTLSRATVAPEDVANAVVELVTEHSRAPVVLAIDDVDRADGESVAVTWLTDDQGAERLRDLREDSTSWLGRSFTGQFSLARAQAKTALLQRDVPCGGHQKKLRMAMNRWRPA